MATSFARVSYEAIASVISQLDKPKISSAPSSSEAGTALNSASAHAHDVKRNKKNSRSGRRKGTLSPQQLLDLKSRSHCHICRQYGHWSTDHRGNSSLKPGIVASRQPPAMNAPAQHAHPVLKNVQQILALSSYNVPALHAPAHHTADSAPTVSSPGPGTILLPPQSSSPASSSSDTPAHVQNIGCAHLHCKSGRARSPSAPDAGRIVQHALNIDPVVDDGAP